MFSFARIDDVTLHYDFARTGIATLVLIHELGGTLESWTKVIEGLPPSFGVLRYEWRGMGASQKIVGSITLDDHVRDLTGLLDYLEIRDPVCIAGCAVGGAIALAFAAACPDRVSGVVAMCPATDVTEEKRQRSLAQIDRIEREGMNVTVNGGLAGGYPPEVRHDIEVYDNYLLQYGGNDPRSFAATLRMVALQDFMPKLSGIRCPTLVLAGRHDQGRPPSLVKRTADAIAGSTYKIVDSAHFMPVQTPALVSREITDFFNLEQRPHP